MSDHPVVPRSDGERERAIRETLAWDAVVEPKQLRADLAWLLSLLSDLREQLGRAQEEAAAMREALHPFAEFATMWDAKPLRGTADAFYGIHHGTEWEATLKVSDCRKAAKVLGYVASAEVK